VLNPDSEVVLSNFGICRVKRGRFFHQAMNNFVVRLMAGFNPEEALRTIRSTGFGP